MQTGKTKESNIRAAIYCPKVWEKFSKPMDFMRVSCTFFIYFYDVSRFWYDFRKHTKDAACRSFGALSEIAPELRQLIEFYEIVQLTHMKSVD